VPVTGALALAGIEIGGAFSCGATTDSTGYCWGWGEAGQLGDGTRAVSAMAPATVAGGLKLVAVSAGVQHACGLAADSTAYCWGENGSGQLGIGAQTDTTRPVPVSGGHTFAMVTAGYDHTCALEPNGAAYCWGENVVGQLGDTNVTSAGVPNLVLGGVQFLMLDAGATHTCGIATGGAAYCWGNGGEGQLGSLPERSCTTPSGTVGCTPTPARVGGGLTFATISAGTHHTCGVTVARVAYCWGWNVNGQLGDGTSRLRVAPVPVGNQAAAP
jgi:alpha-tubulin suppressor-like RCC1 family protein